MIKKIFNKFFYHISLTFFTQILITLFSIYLLNLLSIKLTEEEFGIYLIIKRVAAFGFSILTLNLGISLARYNSLEPENSDLFFLISFFISLILFALITALILYFKNWVSSFLFQEEVYSKYLFPCLLYLFATSLLNLCVGYFRGKKNYLLMNISLFLFWFLSLLLFYLSRSSQDFIFSYVLYSSVTIIIVLIILILISIEKFSIINLKNIREFFLYGVKRIPSVFFFSVIFFVPVLVASNEFSLKQAAYIGIIVSITRMMQMIAQPFNTLFVPSFASMKRYNSNKDINHYCSLIFDIMVGFPLIIGVLLLLFSNEIILLWFGEKYLNVVTYLIIVAPSIGFLLSYVVIRGVLDGLYNYPYNNITTFFGGAFSILFGVSIIIFSLNIKVLVFGFFLSNMMLGLVSFIILAVKSKISFFRFKYIVSVIWFLATTSIVYMIVKNVTSIDLNTILVKITIAVLLVVCSWFIYKKINLLPTDLLTSNET